MTIAVDMTMQEGTLSRNRRLVRYWLYVICILVFAMVIVGGATRLTDSGLSITEWQPILGAIPPLTAEDWQIAFDKYRLIPEYTQINKGMSLDEFKFIFWWEWGHRFLGRIVGLVFFVPLVWFWVRGQLENQLKPRLLLLLFLGGLQGAIGWWMVSSGLVDRVDVSQYRLAVHLVLANIIFAYCLWIARGLLPSADEQTIRSIEVLAPVVLIAVLVQIFLGALVAGLDAGLAFNDWPLMDGAVVPSGLFAQSPAWLNFFENPKMVQYIHRIGAYALLALIFIQWFAVAKSPSTNGVKKTASLVAVFSLVQACIGIITLVMQVPLFWALVHQGGATVLLGTAVLHWRGIKGAYHQS